MAKSRRGGQSAARNQPHAAAVGAAFLNQMQQQQQAQQTPAPQPQQVQQPAPPPPQQTPPANRRTPLQLWQEAQSNGRVDFAAEGYTVEDLRNMSDMDRKWALLAATKQDIPDDFIDNATERFSIAFNNNAKPQVEDTATFLKNTPTSQRIYTAQRPAMTAAGTQITAQEIHDTFKYSDQTLLTGGVLGNGIYFSNVQNTGKLYGTLQSVARLAPNARVIDRGQLRREYDKYVQANPETRKALGAHAKARQDYNNSYAQFAMLRGYQAVRESVGGGEYYYSVFDRSALIFAADTKKPGTW